MYRLENFAAIVASQRKKLKMTQEELASQLGITPQAVSKWENRIGYPDVTLIPHLAEILKIPIEILFGKTQTSHIIQRYGDLPLVAQAEGNVCYSDKTVESLESSQILFTDGSVADLSTDIVYNRGKGEIRILPESDVVCAEEIWKDGDVSDYHEKFGICTSVAISSVQNCNVHILRAEDAVTTVTARGSAKFLASFNIRQDGKTLQVQMQKMEYENDNDNEIRIFLPCEKGENLQSSKG